MQKVEDLHQYAWLVKNAKQDNKNIISNMMLLPGVIEHLAAESKLTYIEVPNGIVFLRDEGDYYRLYYYADPNVKIDFIRMDKPVIIDFVYKNGRKKDTVKTLQRKWRQAGFSPYKTNLKMSMALEDYELYGNGTVICTGKTLHVKQAKPDQISEIRELWYKTLDAYHSSVPDTDTLREQIENGNVFCITQNKKVCAANRLQIENRRASIWLVAVDPGMRKMGLGTALQHNSLTIAKQQECHTFFLWVADDNYAARSIYEKLGFCFDQNVSETYILK